MLMAAKRGLGRGLDDLLDTHDTDLPFLSAYGSADEKALSGLPPSASTDDPQDLFQALVRFLKSENAKIEIKGNIAKCEKWLKLDIVADGVQATLACVNLPLVPSDLMSPGMQAGTLSKDNSSASVIFTIWSVDARRLLSRINEHQKRK
jgi:hypothetical protein